ncbi:MAG: hypothetical protein LBR21_05935 [Propionibacteriaceae bacterium]|jgi:hypothetical protein|nr:hypothetical protein [Propionibacteriaceae bacterium]
MNIGRHRRLGEVTTRDWERLAVRAGVESEWVMEKVEYLAANLPDALSDAVKSSAGTSDSELERRFVDRLPKFIDGLHLDQSGRYDRD